MKLALAFLAAAVLIGLARSSHLLLYTIDYENYNIRNTYRARCYLNDYIDVERDEPHQEHRLGTDVKTETLIIDVWEAVEFTDPRLAWDTDRCGVGSIRQPQNLIWTPDLEVYQSTDATSDWVNQPQVILDGTGNVFYTTAKKLKIYCDLPDPIVDGDHNCTFTMGSVAYGCKDMEITDKIDGISLDYYIGPPLQKEQPWQPISSSSRAYSAQFDCCPDPFCVVDHTITMRYNSSFC